MSATQTEPAAPRARRALPPLMRMTEAAATRLASLYGKGQAGMLLRISVNTKGCSGTVLCDGLGAGGGPWG